MRRFTTPSTLPRGEVWHELLASLHLSDSNLLPRRRGIDRRGTNSKPEINDSLMPVHWEGDLIESAEDKSSVAVLVERMSRAVLLAQMPGTSAESALAAVTTTLQSMVAPLRHTLICNQGREMARQRRADGDNQRALLLLQPAQPLVARHLREHQRTVVPVPTQGSRSVCSQEELDAIADNSTPHRVPR